MAGQLAAEIRQRRPFDTLEEEAALNIFRTAEFLNHRTNEFFGRSDLSGTQYNILRILRGAGCDGITCTEAASRMVTRDPDVTRLVDRMESRGLIARERSADDRRKVLIRLTKQGMGLVDSLDGPVEKMLKAQLGRLGKTKLRQLVANTGRNSRNRTRWAHPIVVITITPITVDTHFHQSVLGPLTV